MVLKWFRMTCNVNWSKKNVIPSRMKFIYPGHIDRITKQLKNASGTYGQLFAFICLLPNFTYMAS